MKKLSHIAVIGILWILTSGFSIIRYDGPYRGRVVDAETGEPIEGVVVLAVWYLVTPTPAGSSRDYYDARETVTNENGEFEIKGKGLRILSRLEPVRVTIFKAGYEYLDVPWVSLKKDIILRKRIKWEDDRAIIPLRKLSMEERRKRLGPPSPPDEAPLEKVILMLKEIDKDRREQGLDTRGIWRGERYE